jgi:hypothetical protein
VTDESTRNTPRPLSQEQQLQLAELQNLESDFIALCNKTGKSRELSLAITNMQQAAFWAVRHVLGDGK